MSLTNEELISQVQNYFYTDDELLQTFEEFVMKNAYKIDLNSDENKLEYTTLYEEYKNLFEKKIEDYILHIGSTFNDFYIALRDRTDESKNSGDALFGEILASVTDYEVFMLMMKDGARYSDHK